MCLEMPLRKGPEFAQWFYDILCTLRPQILKFNLPIGPLGDIDTLVERLQVEGKFSDSVVSFPPPVGVGPASLQTSVPTQSANSGTCISRVLGVRVANRSTVPRT
jgi:hypothetical protein